MGEAATITQRAAGDRGDDRGRRLVMLAVCREVVSMSCSEHHSGRHGLFIFSSKAKQVIEWPDSPEDPGHLFIIIITFTMRSMHSGPIIRCHCRSEWKDVSLREPEGLVSARCADLSRRGHAAPCDLGQDSLSRPAD